MRAVLDVNVLISALLSPRASPAKLLVAWQVGEFDLVVSRALLDELARALTYPKLVRHIAPADAAAFVTWLARSAVVAQDPGGVPTIRSADPEDDYLLALASSERAILVSGDAHLTTLADRVPVRTPAEFMATRDAPQSSEMAP